MGNENLIVEFKICSKCKIEKSITDFYFRKNRNSYYSICKECDIEKVKKYFSVNKDKKCEYDKEYKKKNKEKIKKQRSEHYEKNKKSIRKKKKIFYYENREKEINRVKKYISENKEKVCDYKKRRYSTDILFKLRNKISKVINGVLKMKNKTKNNSSVLQYLPYTIEELKQSLEFKFEPWMTWDNHGNYEKDKLKWHIDHIIPQSLLPYDSMEHPNFQKCWALENLQPLEAIKNIKKGNRNV